MRRFPIPLLVATALVPAVVAIATTAFAADPVTETRDISGVTRLEVGGPATLTISIGTPEQLTINADQKDLDRIDVERDGDKLAVGFNGGIIFNREPEGEIRYDITVASLTELQLHGDVDATASKVTGGDLKLDLSGSSNATLTDTGVSSLDVDISGASTAEIAGSADTQKVDVSGASDYRASDLDSRTANIGVSGASDAMVRAREKLELDASGASNIEYIAPEGAEVAQDESGSSDIRALPYTPLPAASPQAATPVAVNR